MPKVILFDFDGTIADSYNNFLEIYEQLSIKYKFPDIDPNSIERLRDEDARSLINKLNIPMYKIPFLALDMKKLQHSTISNIKTFEGLSDVLFKLKEKFKLGILTSNSKENVISFLKREDISIFDYIYSDASIFGKDKTIYKFISKNNLDKDDVVYIGDEIRDIKACKKAGVKIISVTWGFNSKSGLVNYDPDYLADTPKELLNILLSF
jgi:phosphoglycolate phosphatase